MHMITVQDQTFPADKVTCIGEVRDAGMYHRIADAPIGVFYVWLGDEARLEFHHHDWGVLEKVRKDLIVELEVVCL